jgi:hypothetical protein
MGSKPSDEDVVTKRRKPLQEKDQVAKENEASSIEDMLEGSFFSLQGSEAEGYIWDCPACQTTNTNSPNLSKQIEILSFLCGGCGKIFDVTAVEEGSPGPFSEEEKAQIGTGYEDGPNSLLDQMIAYEEGSLDEDDTVDLFQQLIDSGLVWKLQGQYGRMAKALIDAGLCHSPSRRTDASQPPAMRAPGGERHEAKSKYPVEDRRDGATCEACGSAIEVGDRVYERDGHLYCSKECQKKGPAGEPREASSSRRIKVRWASALKTSTREEYSAFVRTLDNVEELPIETPEGDKIQVKQGSEVVAEVFYPVDGHPVYKIKSSNESPALDGERKL